MKNKSIIIAIFITVWSFSCQKENLSGSILPLKTPIPLQESDKNYRIDEKTKNENIAQKVISSKSFTNFYNFITDDERKTIMVKKIDKKIKLPFNDAKGLVQKAQNMQEMENAIGIVFNEPEKFKTYVNTINTHLSQIFKEIPELSTLNNEEKTNVMTLVFRSKVKQFKNLKTNSDCMMTCGQQLNNNLNKIDELYGIGLLLCYALSEAPPAASICLLGATAIYEIERQHEFVDSGICFQECYNQL